MTYIIPAATRIGHSHLKVSDINKALAFYHDLLGFEIMQRYGDSAVFLSAGGYHHHIGLNTWHSKGSPPAPQRGCGLFHTAVLFSTRKELAMALHQLMQADYPLTGAADHGVSEAIYMNDPDENGVEIYWDKPKEQWPVDEAGHLNMVSDPLDIVDLLSELDK